MNIQEQVFNQAVNLWWDKVLLDSKARDGPLTGMVFILSGIDFQQVHSTVEFHAFS